MRITGWDIKCSTFHSKSQFLIMTSKDKTRKSCENAALTIFTFSQIHSWMKRAKVFACWKGAFTSYEASRRVSEDNSNIELFVIKIMSFLLCDFGAVLSQFT